MLRCIVIEPIHYPGGRRREPGEKLHLPEDVYGRLHKAGCVRTVEEHEILTQAEQESQRFREEAHRAADEAQRAARDRAAEQAAEVRARIEGQPTTEPKSIEDDLASLDDLDRDGLLEVVSRRELGNEINVRRHLTNLREDLRSMLELLLEERDASDDPESAEDASESDGDA